MVRKINFSTIFQFFETYLYLNMLNWASKDKREIKATSV